jgi:hypothetical protein
MTNLSEQGIVPINFDEDFKFNAKTMLIIVSDVHIGQYSAETGNFAKFLQKIITQRNDKKLENLQYFVIIGDFYDRLLSSLHLISEKVSGPHPDPDIKNIFSLLSRIQTELGIPIVSLALGNHENPVNIADFPDGKAEFLKELKDNPDIILTPPDYNCQFAVLKYNQDAARWNLSLYDTADQLAQRESLN